MNTKGTFIGDGSFITDIDKQIHSMERLPKSMDSAAEKIINSAKQIATAKGLNKTGAGISGIIYETENEDRLIGWASRPNLHLYFQEIGTYKDYPRPHVRPAADQKEHEIIEDIRKNVVGD